ncbi:Uncharacterized protein FWK35_00032604, partial [Aphis craccivora]
SNRIHEFSNFTNSTQNCIYCFFKKYVQNLLGNLKEDFLNDSNDRNFLQRNLRGVIFNLGCLYGLLSYKIKVYELFKRFLYDRVQPNPDIRYTVYYYGYEWDKLWELFLSEQEPQEKNEWQYLVDRFSAGFLKNLIHSVCSDFNTYERLKEIKVFFDKFPEAIVEKIDQTAALQVVSNKIK